MLKLTVTIVHIWKRLPGEGFGRVRVELGLRFISILIQIMSEAALGRTTRTVMFRRRSRWSIQWLQHQSQRENE